MAPKSRNCRDMCQTSRAHGDSCAMNHDCSIVSGRGAHTHTHTHGHCAGNQGGGEQERFDDDDGPVSSPRGTGGRKREKKTKRCHWLVRCDCRGRSEQRELWGRGPTCGYVGRKGARRCGARAQRRNETLQASDEGDEARVPRGMAHQVLKVSL